MSAYSTAAGPNILDVTYDVDGGWVMCPGAGERRPVGFCKKNCHNYRMIGMDKMICGWDEGDPEPPCHNGAHVAPENPSKIAPRGLYLGGSGI